MNPMMLMQLKNSWERFRANHPKFPKYLAAVAQRGVQENSLMEFKVTTPDGEVLAANLRLNAEDVELFRQLYQLTH